MEELRKQERQKEINKKEIKEKSTLANKSN